MMSTCNRFRSFTSCPYMKQNKKIVAYLFCLLFLALPSLTLAQGSSAEEILQKASTKLANLSSLSYKFRRELNYETTGFSNEMQIDCFLDMSSSDKIIGARFQFDEPNYTFVFNGSEYFTLNKKKKTYVLKNKPTFTDFDSLPGFYDSLLTLKNSLPGIIADKNITKTLIENDPNKNAYVVDIVLDSKIMTLDGKYFETTPRKFTYRLAVDKATLLPLDLLRTNSVNKDYSRTTFEYSKETISPPETTWYYSTYKNEYKPQAPPEDKLIKVGQNAPEWKLASVKDNTPTALSNYKGKVVMLEFWISFCGYCIAAVPKLNSLEEKYRGKGLEIIGINASDSKPIIDKFVQNNQPKFQLVYGGEETANIYGINGFPLLVLIDRSGKVIYSGEFVPADTKELEALIEKGLADQK